MDFTAPDANYGNDIQIHVKSDKQTRRSYLKFDLSALPAGETVTSAKLYLYCTAGPSTTLQVDVHETSDSWSEGTITWNNAPAVGALAASNTQVNGTGQYYYWDITSYAQSQYGGDKILSVVVKFPQDDPNQNNPNYHRDFASKEYAGTSCDPYLEITYTGQAPDPPAVWTDKADYEFWETVTIFGSGFNPNANINLTVTRPDSVVDTGSTMSNASGNFVYYYVLNGILGTYTVTATDGVNSASTTFTESRYRLQGYTRLPQAKWTDGILKGWYECEEVPYRLKMIEVEATTYVLSNYHDNELDNVTGIDYCTDFYVGYENGSVAPATEVTFSLSGPFYQTPVKIKEIYYTWNVTYTSNAAGKTYYLYWKAHLASGSSNWPGAKLHAKTDITGAQDVPIAVPSGVLGEISGYKFNDLDSDGVWDVSEPVLTDGWNISLYMWDNTTSQWVFQTSTTTDINGSYSFTNLFYGNYKVTEDVKDGWINTLSPGFPITLNGTYPTSEDNNFGNHAVNYILTITTTTGGTTSPSPGAHVYPYCTNVSVTAIPDACYVFDHWELDGSPAGSANPITVHMNANHTLHAVFTQITYTLTITTTAGGTTSPSPGAHNYPCCSNVSVTAIPDSGFAFDHWELDSVDVGSANPYTVHMDSDHTLHAVFSGVAYTLTITTTAGGTTSPSPGAHVYPSGANVPVTATPSACYQFDHWELDGVNVGSANPYTVTMDKDHTLHAVFTQITYTLTIATTTGGTTNPSPGAYVHPCSSNVPVTAIPGSDYVFDHWELDGVDVGSANPYTVHMNSDHTLRAFFKERPTAVGGYALPIDINIEASNSLVPQIGLASVLSAAMAVAIVLTIRRKKTSKREH